MPIRTTVLQGQLVEMVHDETTTSLTGGTTYDLLYVWGRGVFKVYFRVKDSGDQCRALLKDVEGNILETGATKTVGATYAVYSQQFGRVDPGAYIISIEALQTVYLDWIRLECVT